MMMLHRLCVRNSKIHFQPSNCIIATRAVSIARLPPTSTSTVTNSTSRSNTGTYSVITKTGNKDSILLERSIRRKLANEKSKERASDLLLKGVGNYTSGNKNFKRTYNIVLNETIINADIVDQYSYNSFCHKHMNDMNLINISTLLGKVRRVRNINVYVDGILNRRVHELIYGSTSTSSDATNASTAIASASTSIPEAAASAQANLNINVKTVSGFVTALGCVYSQSSYANKLVHIKHINALLERDSSLINQMNEATVANAIFGLNDMEGPDVNNIDPIIRQFLTIFGTRLDALQSSITPIQAGMILYGFRSMNCSENIEIMRIVATMLKIFQRFSHTNSGSSSSGSSSSSSRGSIGSNSLNAQTINNAFYGFRRTTVVTKLNEAVVEGLIDLLCRHLYALQEPLLPQHISAITIGVQNMPMWQCIDLLYTVLGDKCENMNHKLFTGRIVCNALYGLNSRSSFHGNVMYYVGVLKDKLKYHSNGSQEIGDSDQLQAYEISMALYGMNAMSPEVAEVEECLGMLSQKLAQCNEVFNSRIVAFCLHGLSSCNNQSKGARSILKTLRIKLMAMSPTSTIADVNIDMSLPLIDMSLYGLRYFKIEQNDDVKSIIRILTNKMLQQDISDFNNRSICSIIHGIQSNNANRSEIQTIIRFMNDRLMETNEPLNYVDICTLFDCIHKMEGNSVELQELLFTTLSKPFIRPLPMALVDDKIWSLDVFRYDDELMGLQKHYISSIKEDHKISSRESMLYKNMV